MMMWANLIFAAVSVLFSVPVCAGLARPRQRLLVVQHVLVVQQRPCVLRTRMLMAEVRMCSRV